MKIKLLQFISETNSLRNFFLITLILTLRMWERFLFPGLWAEDGVIFLRDSILIGFSSFFDSYAGYYHTIPRLIAFASYKIFPVVLYPYIFTTSSILIYSYTVSQFIKRDYENIFSKKYVRFALTFCLCFVPGLYEVLGNLANLHWILFFYLSILSLKKIDIEFSNVELIYIFFICASTGEPIVLIPIFFLRVLFSFKLKNKKLIFQNSFILICIFMFALINFSRRKQIDQTANPSSLNEIKIASLFTINQYYIYQPILGEKNAVKFYDRQRTIYTFLGIVLTLLICIYYIYFKLYQNNFLFLVLILVLCVPILTWFVRPGSLLQYINIYDVWNSRYSFILSPWGLILWMKLISSINLNSEIWNKRIFISFFILYILFSSYRFFLKPYDKEINWFQDSKKLESNLKTGCPNPLNIMISPKILNPIMGTFTQFSLNISWEDKETCQ